MEDKILAYRIWYNAPGIRGVTTLLIKLKEDDFGDKLKVEDEMRRILGKKYDKDPNEFEIPSFQYVNFEEIRLSEISLGDAVRLFNLEHMEA